MSMCDLEQVFGSTADQLPDRDDDTFLISATTLPQPPAHLITEHLVIRTGEHGYESYTINLVDSLHFQAHKRTYRLLGLCVLAKVFHPEPREIQIQLTHPASDVHTLILDYDQQRDWPLVVGYTKRPDHFLYEVQSAEKYTYALNEKYFPAWLLPLFKLTNAQDTPDTRNEKWQKRDTIHCAGSDYGSVLFANLLLNFGGATEEGTEINLEGAFGYGGVRPDSAEVTIWLPGGFGWQHVL